MTGPLAERRALVTGASGGIGAAVAGQLARAGADLVLTYSGHRDAAEFAATGVRQAGGEATVVHADLAEPGAGRALVERVTADLWARTLAVNTTGPWQMAQAALPGMVGRGFGRVLFVSSVAALNGGVVGPHYAASKAALHGLVHHLAPRVASAGVTVNALAPALIEGTRMLPGGDGGKPPMPIPVGRLGRPDEVAALALAVLTNGYLTDKVITVDGGLYPT